MFSDTNKQEINNQETSKKEKLEAKIMTTNFYFCLLLTILCCLHLASSLAIRRNVVEEASKNECGKGLYNYDSTQEYEYAYSTKTKLWIKDVSNDAESVLNLNATVLVQLVEPCRYQMKLRDVNIQSASIFNDGNFGKELETNVAVFSIGSNGVLSTNVKFGGNDEDWINNVKRGIISAFQLRSSSELKSTNVFKPKEQVKSSVLYETDLFGKCRTTYKSTSSNNGINIVKNKALHTCSLDPNYLNPVHGEDSKTIAVRTSL